MGHILRKAFMSEGELSFNIKMTIWFSEVR